MDQKPMARQDSIPSRENMTQSSSESKSENLNQERLARRTEFALSAVSQIMPPKFSGVKFPMKAEFAHYVPPPKNGLCLFGKSGVGKTTVMAMIVREYFLSLVNEFDVKMSDRIAWWKFVSYPGFIMQVQDSFRNDGEESAYQLLKRMAAIPYLIIDDLGAEKPTEFVRQATYFLINEREMNLRITFITTNFSMDHLDQNIDARIASRISGMCDVVEMAGKDRRLAR